jgi:hypothetical protein
LEGTRLSEIELRDAGDILEEELRASLAPTRIVCSGRVVDVEEKVPNLTRFKFDGTGAIPATEALELTVVGGMPASFPSSVRSLDLLCAEAAVLTSVNRLPFLRRLVAPAVLERVDKWGVAHCPRLEEVVFGEAPVREFSAFAFREDFVLERFPLPATLRRMDGVALFCTAILRLDASECASLESFASGWVLNLSDMTLPNRFWGELLVFHCKSIERATFGWITLRTWSKFSLVFAEVRFTSLTPPRGDFTPEMVAEGFIFGETAQLLGRVAAPARPP